MGVRNLIPHTRQPLLLQVQAKRDRKRSSRPATCCSRPATGAVLAHPVAASRPFAGIECMYGARIAGDFF